MSEMEAEDGAFVPEFDRADRMKKALRHAGAEVQEIADYLGVSRNSAGNWINGHVTPSVPVMRLWAFRCGVSYNWLCHGTPEPCAHRRSTGKRDCLWAA